MKVYLAWSGEVSGKLAAAFESWLPLVIQHIKTFYSPTDIDKGTRWAKEISEELESCNAGILFVTPDNLESRWIHFEAGALSKSVEVSRVTPVLFGIERGTMEYPLAQFQSATFSRVEVYKLIRDYNAHSANPVEADVIDATFGAFWPTLEAQVTGILADGATKHPPKTESEQYLLEILELTRRIASQVNTIESNSPVQRMFTAGDFRIGHLVTHSTLGKGEIKSTSQFIDGQKWVVFRRDSDKKMYRVPPNSTDLQPFVPPSAADDLDDSDPFADE